MITDILTTAVGLLLLGLIGWAYVFLILRLRRWVQLLEGRDVMSKFRPTRQEVAATDRELDDIHYGVVVGS